MRLALLLQPSLPQNASTFFKITQLNKQPYRTNFAPLTIVFARNISSTKPISRLLCLKFLTFHARIVLRFTKRFMWKIGLPFLLFCISLTISFGQNDDIQIKVYDFDEGLSHRIVSKITQDSAGFIWISTINGLNRFDGYEFIPFEFELGDSSTISDAITDMAGDNQSRIWLANPNYLTLLDPNSNETQTVKIKSGPIERRTAAVPHSLYVDEKQRVWMATYDEKTGITALQTLDQNGEIITRLALPGNYTKRPITAFGDHIYLGAIDNELWKLDQEGQFLEKFSFPLQASNRQNARIVQLQVSDGVLWVLLMDGRVFSRSLRESSFAPHAINSSIAGSGIASSLFIESNNNIWVGGQGLLWHYNSLNGVVSDYDEPIRQILKNTCTYKQIFKDRSDVIWLSTDFGAIKIVKANNLFTQYLSGGSDFCSNIYCSTRGITEDDKGNIYLSYYNSIHKLDPSSNRLRLLFPANNYFNYPFGLTYHDQALWTGNGRRIDLRTLRVDTLFNLPNLDLGDVLVTEEDLLWFGYLEHLFIYDSATKKLDPFQDSLGQWDTIHGRISYLYEGRAKDCVWVGTLENGVYKIDKIRGRVMHLHQGESSPIRLNHNQINVIYEDTLRNLWIGTKEGLHRINLADSSAMLFTTNHGLPNNFVNGLLSEGDTSLWISTDNGLCRLSIEQKSGLSFFTQDGLSSNEFNRISFYKAKDGRMYFGGLNGVNAFYPDQLSPVRQQQQLDALLVTNFIKFDGESDSIISENFGLSKKQTIELSHKDKIFGFSFALANYKNPLQNKYSFFLEGFDSKWSEPSTVNQVRYNNIPAGSYQFRVKASSGKEDWIDHELVIPVIIHEAYYRTWWFWTLIGLILLSTVFGIMRYRIYLIQQQQDELEALVKARTLELEQEKQKSEDLLLNILPAETAEELKKFGVAKAKRHEFVTVMFSDFQAFTRISELMDPEELVAQIDYCFRAFDEIIERHGLEKIKTVGDAYLCVGGIGHSNADNAAEVVKAALEIQEFMSAVAIEKSMKKEYYFEARIGIHTGPVVAGIVGIKKFAYDIWGDTVNVASRMETHGKVGRVNISETTYQLIKAQFECSYNDQFVAQNNRSINMYFVEQYQGDPVAPHQGETIPTKKK